MKKTEGYKEWEKAVKKMHNYETVDTHEKKYDYRDMMCSWQFSATEIALYLGVIAVGLFIALIYVLTEK